VKMHQPKKRNSSAPPWASARRRSRSPREPRRRRRRKPPRASKRSSFPRSIFPYTSSLRRFWQIGHFRTISGTPRRRRRRRWRALLPEAHEARSPASLTSSQLRSPQYENHPAERTLQGHFGTPRKPRCACTKSTRPPRRTCAKSSPPCRGNAMVGTSRRGNVAKNHVLRPEIAIWPNSRPGRALGRAGEHVINDAAVAARGAG
jgi:hypothetical protein